MRRGAGLLLLGLAAVACAADVAETVSSAYKAFLEGRVEDAASSYRYLSELGVGGAETDANLALLQRDAQNKDAALPLWLKATLQDADGFVWDQRGWAYLAENRGKEAREAFLKAIDRSSTTATQAEANLGLGLAALSRSDPKMGTEPLRSALVQGPYMVPAASYETALTALALGDKHAAMEYLRQGLQIDPSHLESLRLLGSLYEKIGENRAAWRVYAKLSALDPKDPEWAGKVKKLQQYIPGDPETSMAVRRVARPVLDATAAPAADVAASTPSIRVALYSDMRTGAPATLTQVYFMTNVPFKLVATNGETVKEDGKPFDQWGIEFRAESNLVEVRDASRNIVFTTKTPFKIVPLDRQGTVLLKSGKFVEIAGFDRGDREVRGALEVRPTPYGFKAVNELPLEDYLYGVVGAALPQGSPVEAYKAEAVVARTLALWSKTMSPPNMEKADICDSRKCQRYVGVNEEMREASKAVAATDGYVLTKGGRLARAMQHEHCGGFTENGSATGDPALADFVSAADGPGPALPATPLQLERFVHEFPAHDRYCEAQTLTSPSEARWVRLLDAKDLQGRADRIQNVGTLRAIRVKGRTATGRVKALAVEGSRGVFTLEGYDAIAEFLSPGTLRSTLFTIQPLLGAAGPVQWLVWGAGTGHGLGMCRAGALGQAVVGRKYKEILSVYFPGYGVESPKVRPPAPVVRDSNGYRRPRNPRFNKKTPK